ncbi:MAG TPA: PAS domain S-box protein [Terriglobales bacterium]|nr:PAS domain S-box protein [Terriglobales bacterium]
MTVRKLENLHPSAAVVRLADGLASIPQQVFDDLVLLASQVCAAPYAVISFADKDGFISIGMGWAEALRESALYAQTLATSDLFVVPDASQDPRFVDDAMVTGSPGIRFYAGVQMEFEDGKSSAVLCVMDRVARHLTREQRNALQILARHITTTVWDVTQRQQMEEALRDSEARFRTLADTFPNGVFIYSGKEVLYVNRYICDITGYTVEELLARPVGALAHPDDHARIAERAYNMMEGKDNGGPFHYRFITKSGKLLSVESRATPLIFEGKPSILSVAVDVSEKKQAEEALREREERYRNLFENNLAGVYRATPEGRLLECNDSFLRVFGFRHIAEAQATPLRELWANPSDRDEKLKFLRTHGKLKDHELRMRRITGEEFWALGSGVLVQGRDGPTSILEGTVIDISARKTAEEQLRLSEERHRKLVDESLGLMCTHSLDGRLLSINPAALQALGWGEEEWRGRKIQDVLAPEVRNLYDDYVRRAVENNSDSNFMRVVRPDGSVRIWSYKNVMAREPGKEPFIVGHALDVTEILMADRRIRESEEKYRDLFENASELIYSLTLDGHFEYVNPACMKTLAYADEEVNKLSLLDIVAPEYREISRQELDRLRRGQPSGIIERVFVAKNGSRIMVEGSVGARRDKHGQISSLRGIFHDITRRKNAEENARRTMEKLKVALEKEKDLSRKDFLTGLNNRRVFFELGDFEAKRSSRHRRALSLVYIDLDNFKQVNDTLGHQVGDDLLVTVASTLEASLRSTDIIARLGGDEFAVLFPETGSPIAQQILSKLHDRLLNEMRKCGWPVTFSIGIATFPDCSLGFEEMIRHADEVMYTAKKSGGNRITATVIERPER